MSAQLRFFRKNLIDQDQAGAVTFNVNDATATNNGLAFTDLMRNRDNNSGWATTGSNDAANTTLGLTFNGVFEIDTIIIAAHNLKSFTLQYRDLDSGNFVDFSTPINETVNTKDTNFFGFNTVNTTGLQLVISGTQVADSDKFIAQFIVTRKIKAGQLEGWPILKAPTVDLLKKPITTISGKSKIIQRVGAYSVSMDFNVWPSDSDLELLENLHFFHPKGFLFWPAAGDEEQFRYKRIGFRNRDIYLCGVASEWKPEWERGIYVNGMNMRVNLVEVI